MTLQDTPNNLIAQLKKLHHQYTIPASVLMAIRARMEFKQGLASRIGQVYPNGNRHVLVVGKAGAGKTRLLRAIFEGLNLESVNSDGRHVGKWISSAGASTGIGIFETLEIYNDCIIGIDELNLDTPTHLHVIKQISNGEIMRPRHENIDPTPFSGLVLASTNAVTIPRSPAALEHLLAVLDRFMVVKARSPEMTPGQTISVILDESKKSTPSIECDWELLRNALIRKVQSTLNKDEEQLLQTTWAHKSREVLDVTRPQWRNSWAAYDIFLFVKRFLGIEDISKNLDAIKLVQDMVADCIIFNPISILWLPPLEEVIYKTTAKLDSVAIQDIFAACETTGQVVSRQHIYRILNKMITNGVLCRAGRGRYAVKVNRLDTAGGSTEEAKDRAGTSVVDVL